MALSGLWASKNVTYQDPNYPTSYPLDPEHSHPTYENEYYQVPVQPVPPNTDLAYSDVGYPPEGGGFQIVTDEDNRDISDSHDSDRGSAKALRYVQAPDGGPSTASYNDTPHVVVEPNPVTFKRQSQNSYPENNPDGYRLGLYRWWDYDRSFNASPIGWNSQPHILMLAGPAVPGAGNEVYIPARRPNRQRPMLYRESRPWDEESVSDGQSNTITSQDDFTPYW